MSTLDTGLTLIRTAAGRVSAVNGWMGNAFKSWMPTGLYARALLIMIVPMVVLQSVVAFVFMERHWNTVTRHLSAAVVSDIAALIDVYKSYPQDKDRAQIRRIAQQRLGLVVDFLPSGDMPPPRPKPFFSLLDQTLSVQLGRQIAKPFCSCATRSARSCGWPMPPRASARAARRRTSAREERAKCAVPPMPSWK